jgi:hypothetical protein
MFPGIYNTGVQVEANRYVPGCENSEEYGQKYGRVVVLSTWRDRLSLKFGQLLITMGEKLTTSSLKNMQLSKDLR